MSREALWLAIHEAYEYRVGKSNGHRTSHKQDIHSDKQERTACKSGVHSRKQERPSCKQGVHSRIKEWMFCKQDGHFSFFSPFNLVKPGKMSIFAACS